MPVIGVPRIFHKKFSFAVQIDAFTYAGFQKMSALEVEVAEIKQYEGGSLIPDKSAGRVEFKDITLERGATTADWDAMIWFSSVMVAPFGVGFRDPAYKRNLQVFQLERDGLPAKHFMLIGAWPKVFTAGEWDNTVDENVIEKMTLCYDYFIRLT